MQIKKFTFLKLIDAFVDSHTFNTNQFFMKKHAHRIFSVFPNSKTYFHRQQKQYAYIVMHIVTI